MQAGMVTERYLRSTSESAGRRERVKEECGGGGKGRGGEKEKEGEGERETQRKTERDWAWIEHLSPIRPHL